MEIRFTRSARKHKVGRASARHVMEGSEPVVTSTERGPTFNWVGADERGRELEVVAVIGERDGALLVIHVMPSALRRRS